MSFAILFVVVIGLLAAPSYLGFVLYKRKIGIHDIRLRNTNDVKKLLTLPATDGPLRYLRKVA